MDSICRDCILVMNGYTDEECGRTLPTAAERVTLVDMVDDEHFGDCDLCKTHGTSIYPCEVEYWD